MNVRQSALALETFYSRRAQRQQTLLDLGSTVTFVGAAGAFEGGISDSTRNAWIIAGVLPSVIGRINSFEPTRELYHGGALAVHLITLRHERLTRAMTMLQDPRPPDCSPLDSAIIAITESRERARAAEQVAANAQSLAQRQPNATNVRAAQTRAAEAAAARYDPDGVLLGEARRLRGVCSGLRRRAAAIRTSREQAGRFSDAIAVDFANDLLQLDRALLAKDRDLRYTPIETLTALATSPLRALDSLVSGENSQAALDSLKTQIAFSGLNRSLSTIALPPIPPTIPAVGPVAGLSEAALALEQSGNSSMAAVVHVLRDRAEQLADDQQALALEERFVSDLLGAVAADYLTFQFDAPTGTTVVTVGPRPAQPALAATTQ